VAKIPGTEIERPRIDGRQVDGNVFSVIGAVRKALRQAGAPNSAKEFQDKALSSHSYDAVLALAQDYADFYFSDEEEYNEGEDDGDFEDAFEEDEDD
jgi:hypothetical protein